MARPAGESETMSPGKMEVKQRAHAAGTRLPSASIPRFLPRLVLAAGVGRRRLVSSKRLKIYGNVPLL
jgi:hypothetical protein